MQLREKIWIQHDGTEEGIANRLVEMRVPKQDIILAFHEPCVRQFTDFGTGEATFYETAKPNATPVNSTVAPTLWQRQLRQALKLTQSGIIKNQLGKFTERPTFRWIFQCFQAVHLLIVNDAAQVANLAFERLRILKFFQMPVIAIICIPSIA